MKRLDKVGDVLWPQHQLQRPAREQQLSYWQHQLTNLPDPLILSTDHPRSARPVFNGGSYSFHLSSALTSALERLGQSEDATLFMTLLAAFQVWLCRHSNQQEDILIGVPATAQVEDVEHESPGGLFTNTLIMRTNLMDNPGFLELLRRVREVTIQAYRCQDVPVEQVINTIQPENSLSNSPLVHALFQMKNVSTDSTQLAEFNARALEPGNTYKLFDIALDVIKKEKEDVATLDASFLYNTHLFDEGTIIRFAQRFVRLLEAIVAQPYELIQQLPILPDEECELLAVANATQQEIAPHLQGLCIHQLFEAQVALTPDAPALMVKGETLSYAQLNRKANQLAHRLRLMGVGPEVLVGLCLPRTTDLPIALLAILKAGGAYVPLDPAYPTDRLRFQIQDSGAHLLLTISSLEHLWQEIEVTRLYLDQTSEMDQADASQWESNLESNLHEDHLAYVIYTSGSTGYPKGVCIAHRNTMALIHWALRIYSLEDVRGMVAGTSICFDLSAFELFVPLSCGGTIYLVENGLHLPEGDARERCTLLNMVPSVMAELARTTAIPASVRVITFCGETLPRPLVESLYKLPGVQRIYNLYGPTEDTTYSTWSLLARDEHSENVPIGLPLDNSQTYVLDHNGHQVPLGVTGEIYLGGAGVARGYWKRPEMTAQRFLPDPFSQQRGAHLYRTGDLARYRADGQLEFLGRIDQQVKIRGHRIELGEIESVLRQSANVQDCVVLVRKPEGGSMHSILVAYIVPINQHKLLEDELLAFLKQRVPDYMFPSFFVSLETLPKTTNGKIDRKALPDPQMGKERKQPYASQTKLVKPINLSAGKRELFKRLLKKKPTSSPVLPLSEPGTDLEKELFPLAFSQQRYWIIDQLDPGTPAYNIFFASRITGNFNLEILTRSIHEIVRRHEPLRTAFIKVDGVPMQQICPPSNFPIPIIDLRSLDIEQQQQEERRLLKQEPLVNFDVSQGLQIRVSVIKLANNVHIFMVTIHHISSDGWSIGVFREELNILYEALSQGRPSPLLNLPVRYVEYVLWQRNRLQGDLLEPQLSYWRHKLANLSSPLLLPTDRPRPTRQTFNGKIYKLSLPPTLIPALQQVGQNEGVTLFMTLFAVFQILMCRLSGQEDILVGTPIASRQRTDFGKLIGCFVNTIVFRTDMKGNPPFRTLLQRVRTMALEAYSYQDVPFEQVLYDVRPERGTTFAYAPLFQVMFHYENMSARITQNVEMSAEKIEERNAAQPVKLTVEPLEERNAAAKFDLSLRMNIQETEDNPYMMAVFLYNTDLFNDATIVRFGQGLQCLLEAVIAQPDQRIWQLPFLPEFDPFSTNPSAPQHEISDLTRHLSNGNIESPRHIDDQIEGRGVHIELGEVQAVLSRHPAVRSVVVIARKDALGDRQLVANIVLQERQTVTVDDLQNYIAHYLPSRMIPSRFVLLDALASHEEVDRQALSISENVKENVECHVTPQSEVEVKLVHIWENLLRINSIGVHDNFFDLGGNSLIGVRLMAQIQREFQQDLPLSVLLQKTTPEQLAKEVLRRRWSSTRSVLVEIQPAGTKLPFFCIHPIGGEVFCYADLARQLGTEHPFYGLRMPEQDYQQRPLLPIEEMACSYIVEMQKVQPNGPYLLGGWSMGGVIAFEVAQQLLQQGQTVALLALFDSQVSTGQQLSAKTLVQQFGEDLEGVFSQTPSIDYSQLQDLSTDELLAQVYTCARLVDIIPPDLELGHLMSMFSIYKRNVDALHLYQPRGYTGPLTLFLTSSLERDKQAARILEWQTLALQEVEVHILPGDHYSFLKKPHLNHLVEQLKHCLEKIE